MDNQNKQQNNKAIKDQVALEHFVDQLIRDKNDANVKPEQVPQIKALLLKELNEAINTQLVNALLEKDQVALDELLDKNPSDDEVNKFFMEKIPNLEAEIASALLSFRAAYLYVPGQEATKSAADVPPPPPPAPVQ